MKCKLLLFSLLTSFSVAAVSQSLNLNKTYIASGGQYGDPSDHVAVGFIHPETQDYQTFDSIYTQSVQDLIIDDEYIFVNAGDSLVCYNKSTH